MKRFFGLITLIFVFSTGAVCAGGQATDLRGSLSEFQDSFIKHYEFNTSGRYAHEYHPFILKKTSQSMSDLEEAFQSTGFKMPGRYVLMGYEEGAFPSFFPRIRDCEGFVINDEASFKDPRGWCIQLHNRFGTMTGFLLRSINEACEKQSHKLFEHVRPERVEIFSQGLGMMQKHSFGELSRSMFELESDIFDLAKKEEWRPVFDKLINFWTALYNGEYKTGDKQVAGTQDILFSIENAKFLKSSKLDLIRFYMGADITYPVVVSKLCSKDATANAQEFIKRFSKQLKPMDDKKTLYVFRSFVDGVGKSTLLGNIKNWMQHQDKVEDYEIVDNTSTLDAEIFKFDDDVYIADLPAQMSHFTYKPEGMVWVDVKAVNCDDFDPEASADYFANNMDALKADYAKLVEKVKGIIAKDGSASKTFSDISKPEQAFVRNLIILKELDRNVWIPFNFQGKHFLGNLDSPSQVRVFMKIGNARSEGLKNVQAAQMIFSDGVGFPATYQEFVDNLIDRSKDLKIENVVFVDFMSMYSRSSRENIRINYLLQIMGLMDDKFDPYNTLYRNFVSNSELLAMLVDPRGFESCNKSFLLEVLVRFGLYSMMKEKVGPIEGVRNFHENDVIEFLKGFLATLTHDEKSGLEKEVTEKSTKETEHLQRVYKETKEFVNLHSLDLERIYRFSNFVSHFFKNGLKNKRINAIWDNLEGDVVSAIPREDGWVNNPNYVVELASGRKARLLCVLSEQNRDPAVISKLLRTIRSAWYMELLNVLLAKDANLETLTVRTEEFVRQVPVLLKKGPSGRICLIEKFLDMEVDEQNGNEFEMRRFSNELYVANYCFANTAYGMFGFGSDISTGRYSYSDPGYTLTSFLARKKMGATSNKVSKAGPVWDGINRDIEFYKGYAIRQNRHNQQEKNKNSKKKGKDNKKSESSELTETLKTLRRKIEDAIKDADNRDPAEFDGLSGNKGGMAKPKSMMTLSGQFVPAAQIFARFVVTLESIARDLDSSIAVGREKEDFFAGLKLVEDVLLSQMFGIVFQAPLFRDAFDPNCQPIADLDYDSRWM